MPARSDTIFTVNFFLYFSQISLHIFIYRFIRLI